MPPSPARGRRFGRSPRAPVPRSWTPGRQRRRYGRRVGTSSSCLLLAGLPPSRRLTLRRSTWFEIDGQYHRQVDRPAIEAMIPADAPTRPRALAVLDGVLAGRILTDD